MEKIRVKGLHLKKMRELYNFTQIYVAKQMNVSQAYYSRIENKDFIPKSLALDFCNALDIDSKVLIRFIVFYIKYIRKKA